MTKPSEHATHETATLASADQQAAVRILLPWSTEAAERAEQEQRRFVYYTSADTAMRILANREWWLRNATTMNDFSEVHYGFAVIRQALEAEEGRRLLVEYDQLFDGLSTQLLEAFPLLESWLRAGTYLTCLSEHEPFEDGRGRLSMWRGYGGRTGVALVINGAVMQLEATALSVVASPVFYGESGSTGAQFRSIAERVRVNAALFKRLDRDFVFNAAFQMLAFAVLCTKHPGFSEEREWRVIASPLFPPTKRVISAVESVRGVPQRVLKIPLVDDPSVGLVGLQPRDLFDQVIVGPCDHPEVTAEAFIQLLEDVGMSHEQAIVTVKIADIPLRHL
jgi:hypothetical protein